MWNTFDNYLTKGIGPVTWLKFGRVSDIIGLNLKGLWYHIIYHISHHIIWLHGRKRKITKKNLRISKLDESLRYWFGFLKIKLVRFKNVFLIKLCNIFIPKQKRKNDSNTIAIILLTDSFSGVLVIYLLSGSTFVWE